MGYIIVNIQFFHSILKLGNMIFKLFKTMESLLLGSQRHCLIINIYCLLNSPPYMATLHQKKLECSWLK
jgi:hypothetical protein